MSRGFIVFFCQCPCYEVFQQIYLYHIYLKSCTLRWENNVWSRISQRQAFTRILFMHCHCTVQSPDYLIFLGWLQRTVSKSENVENCHWYDWKQCPEMHFFLSFMKDIWCILAFSQKSSGFLSKQQRFSWRQKNILHHIFQAGSSSLCVFWSDKKILSLNFYDRVSELFIFISKTRQHVDRIVYEFSILSWWIMLRCKTHIGILTYHLERIFSCVLRIHS